MGDEAGEKLKDSIVARIVTNNLNA